MGEENSPGILKICRKKSQKEVRKKEQKESADGLSRRVPGFQPQSPLLFAPLFRLFAAKYHAGFSKYPATQPSWPLSLRDQCQPWIWRSDSMRSPRWIVSTVGS